jgi:hypothetical protein
MHRRRNDGSRYVFALGFFCFELSQSIGTGGMNHERILGSGRFSACAKSPLTGIFGESLGGGYNAEGFKRTGFQ